MRPPVLDRIEKGRSWPRTGTDRTSTDSAPRPRGPKARPTLQLWEHATWRARMRAWCNQLKSVLLGAAHDPGLSQAYRVVQTADCPIDSPATWLSWWDGEAIPRPTHIAAANLISPGSAELLDLTEMRTPVSRHLLALDIVNTLFRRIGRPSDYRQQQASRLLHGLNDAWVSFLDTSPPGKTNRYHVENQIGESVLTLLGTVELTVDQFIALDRLGNNPGRWAMPSEALLEYNWLEPLSIFRFLVRLAGSNKLSHPKLLEMWAHDLATATMLVRTFAEVADRRLPQFPLIRMGVAGAMHILATMTFSTPPNVIASEDACGIAASLFAGDADLALSNLHEARACYFGAFADLGISERALRSLNGTHWEKTWDGAFAAARARL
jgi:hypothetical protein